MSDAKRTCGECFFAAVAVDIDRAICFAPVPQSVIIQEVIRAIGKHDNADKCPCFVSRDLKSVLSIGATTPSA